MIARLFDAFFGCRHSHYSFPITVRARSRRNSAAMLTGTYVACLDCGKDLPYDWHDMRVITSTVAERGRIASLAAKEAA
jgi:hypothetical protein